MDRRTNPLTLSARATPRTSTLTAARLVPYNGTRWGHRRRSSVSTKRFDLYGLVEQHTSAVRQIGATLRHTRALKDFGHSIAYSNAPVANVASPAVAIACRRLLCKRSDARAATADVYSRAMQVLRTVRHRRATPSDYTFSLFFSF